LNYQLVGFFLSEAREGEAPLFVTHGIENFDACKYF